MLSLVSLRTGYRVMGQSCHWEHVNAQAPLEQCKVCLHGGLRLLTPPQPGLSPLGSTFSHCLVQVCFGRQAAHPAQQTPQALLQPLANCSCSPDAHPHSRAQWLGKGPRKTQVETESGRLTSSLKKAASLCCSE